MTEKGRERLLLGIPAVLFLAGLLLLNGLWQNRYQEASSDQISAFCGTVLEQCPELEEELVASLKEFQEDSGKLPSERSAVGEAFLTRYGYESRNFGMGTVREMGWLTAAVGGSDPDGLFPVRRLYGGKETQENRGTDRISDAGQYRGAGNARAGKGRRIFGASG